MVSWERVQKSLDAIASEPSVACIALTLAWCVGAFGMPWSLVLLLGFWMWWWERRQRRRRHRNERWQIHRCLNDPRVATALLGNDLPPWAVFPSVERAQWLSRVLEGLWPFINRQLKENISDSLNPILELYQPPFLHKFFLSRCDFGSIAPLISGVEVHSTDNETAIDFHIVWSASDADICIVAAVGLVEIETKVQGLHIQSLVRLVCGPHVPKWPCFGAVSVCFIDKPTIDFSLVAAKIPFDAIPGFSSFLDSFLRSTLASMMQYPKRLVFPILSSDAAAALLSQETVAEPVGTIVVIVKSAEGLPKRFLQDCNSYVSVTVTSGEKETRTVEVHDDRNPNYHDKRATFTVFNVPNERLVLRVMNAANVTNLGGATEIGRVELFSSVLVATRGEQLHKMRLLGTTAEKNHARITFSTSYKQLLPVAQVPIGFIPPLHRDSATHEEHHAAENGGSRKGSEQSGKHQQQQHNNSSNSGQMSASSSLGRRQERQQQQMMLEKDRRPPGEGRASGDDDGGGASGGLVSRQDTLTWEAEGDGPPTMLGAAGSNQIGAAADAPPDSPSAGRVALPGVLLIRLAQCTRLPQSQLLTQIVSLGMLPDVFVKMSIGHISTRSVIAKKSLNPVFNSDYFLDFRSALSENLVCEVVAQQQLTPDAKLAWTTIPLAEVLHNGGRCKQTWTLSPAGEIHMDLRMLLRMP